MRGKMTCFWDDYKNVKPKVRALLTEIPECRDNDNLLIAEIWQRDLKRDMVPISELLDMLARKQIHSPESIRRSRQKLQEDFKNLRGKFWAKRHKHSAFVRKEIVDADELLES